MHFNADLICFWLNWFYGDGFVDTLGMFYKIYSMQ